MSNGNHTLHINFEKIPISIYPTADQASKSVAKEIADLIRQKQKAGKLRYFGTGYRFVTKKSLHRVGQAP